MSVSLHRARRRFFLRNLVTGIAIASFAAGVWAYSISAVKQDVFDDVDEQARVLNAVPNDPPVSTPQPQSPTASGSASVAAEDIPRESRVSPSPVLDANISDRPRGLLFAALGHRHSWLFEPIHKTLVWGAPPVDRIGRIQDIRLVEWRK